ncbi:hypothetical protein [Fictibacillus sp. NRS-1165]|uniref:hypothetical protein n=1 Tax=Fictibacillus sp. NRS-1165 TaxID=3144463 RepID=UPI003D1ECC04
MGKSSRFTDKRKIRRGRKVKCEGVVNLKKFIFFIKDWYSFGKDQGFLFALKYKLGVAKEGKDFD